MVIDGDVVHQSEGKDADGKRTAAAGSRAWSPNPDVVSFDACKRPELWEMVALGGSPTKNCGAIWWCFCKKKERGGCCGGGLYIAGLGLVGKLGFARGGGLRSDGGDARRARDGHRPGEEETDGWVPPVRGEEAERETLLGLCVSGPGQDSGLGQKWPPAAFFIFFISFPFIFSYFLFSFITLAKFVQINSNKILNSSNIHH
jgi:hypothetical protein